MEGNVKKDIGENVESGVKKSSDEDKVRDPSGTPSGKTEKRERALSSIGQLEPASQKTLQAPDPKPVAKKPVKIASVIPLPVRSLSSENRQLVFRKFRPQQFRRRLLGVSFVLCVLIPAVLGGLYFAFIASDRYVAGAAFSVRGAGANAPVGGDFLGAPTGQASTGTTTTDSYILLEYMKSRELIDRLAKDYDFRAAYGNSNVDFLYRLGLDEPTEEVVDYWSWMITPIYDNTSGIISFEVEAFDPDDAQKIAALILKYCGELINELSEQARRNAVRFATEEVAKAEVKLRVIRSQLRDFRETENANDPTKNVEVQIELMTGLEKQLLDVRSRLGVLKGTIDEASPAVAELRRQEAALVAQITEKQGSIGGQAAAVAAEEQSTTTTGSKRTAPLPELLSDYEALAVDKEFAQQAYVMALASLERSRAEADRQQRYLAVFALPSYPEDPIYPRRALNTLLLLVVLTTAWGIGILLVYSVRDHLR